MHGFILGQKVRVRGQKQIAYIQEMKVTLKLKPRVQAIDTIKLDRDICGYRIYYPSELVACPPDGRVNNGPKKKAVAKRMAERGDKKGNG